jgi:hypothetical protein
LDGKVVHSQLNRVSALRFYVEDIVGSIDTRHLLSSQSTFRQNSIRIGTRYASDIDLCSRPIPPCSGAAVPFPDQACDPMPVTPSRAPANGLRVHDAPIDRAALTDHVLSATLARTELSSSLRSLFCLCETTEQRGLTKDFLASKPHLVGLIEPSIVYMAAVCLPMIFGAYQAFSTPELKQWFLIADWSVHNLYKFRMQEPKAKFDYLPTMEDYEFIRNEIYKNRVDWHCLHGSSTRTTARYPAGTYPAIEELEAGGSKDLQG